MKNHEIDFIETLLWANDTNWFKSITRSLNILEASMTSALTNAKKNPSPHWLDVTLYECIWDTPTPKKKLYIALHWYLMGFSVFNKMCISGLTAVNFTDTRPYSLLNAFWKTQQLKINQWLITEAWHSICF